MRFYCSILFAVNSTFYAAVCNYLLLRQNTGRLNEILQRSAISCNKLVVKALTSLQMRCHTALWYTANTITVGFVDSLTLMSSRPTNSHSRINEWMLYLLSSFSNSYNYSKALKPLTILVVRRHWKDSCDSLQFSLAASHTDRHHGIAIHEHKTLANQRGQQCFILLLHRYLTA